VTVPLRLIWRNLLAHRLRSSLTTGSVFLAVALLCVLRATTGALTTSVERAANNRLWVQSAVSLFVDLPLSYAAKIEAVDGVESVCRFQWFGGVYRDGEGFFAQFAVDPVFLSMYPEIEVVDGSYDQFAANQTGCLVGADLTARYGWKVGDRVPLLGTIFPRPGGAAWEFTIEAIYRAKTTTVDQMTMYFHFDYLRESIASGEVEGSESVGVYLVKLRDPDDATQVMADIDALFENGPQRVQTTTDAEFARQFLGMLGNVPALLTMIGGAVLFAIFFAVLNTMMMAGRERVRDVGILKALGFTDGAVLAMMVGEGIPGFEVTGDTAATGLGIAAGVGLVAGAIPGWLAGRLAPVRALRMEA
jgi:putative ABC transport system permease protein